MKQLEFRWLGQINTLNNPNNPAQFNKPEIRMLWLDGTFLLDPRYKKQIKKVRITAPFGTRFCVNGDEQAFVVVDNDKLLGYSEDNQLAVFEYDVSEFGYFDYFTFPDVYRENWFSISKPLILNIYFEEQDYTSYLN